MQNKQMSAVLERIIPSEWLDIYLRENPHLKEMADRPIEGFEKRRRQETREAIEAENEQRKNHGKELVTIVGVHAAPQEDSLSRQMIDRITDSARDVGMERKIIEISTDAGMVSREAIDRAVQDIRSADGLVITTHTKGGRFNLLCTALFEALEDVDLHGKLVGFAHTYDSPAEDMQVGPSMVAQRFFQEKGCLILPYSFMYAHTGSKDEAWVERDIVGNGIRIARGIERLTRSHLVNLLEDPDALERRKVGGTLNPEWGRLKKRVGEISAERKEQGQKRLNVLFVLGGESEKGKGVRISKLLGKNFEFLGLKTNTLHLASQEGMIESTMGNPNLTLANVVGGEGARDTDASMQEAYRALLQADMIIFSTPVRWFNISWHLQKFMERMTPLEASGFLLEGKAFGTIVTFGEAGGTEVQSHLDHFALHNGLMSIPFGGINEHLTFDLKQSRGLPFAKAHGMAARGTALLVDFLAADGSEMRKIDFKDIQHPLEEMVDPGD